ncbi:YdcF family protein [Lactobacillus sp. LL6]|uniref:YdcF family protein n=1 Tax=Lactobacillus sp. LL6 TaxID=2596827 RepID=UPI001185C612|nr:YdcF family protein [Lactobacillus sp. LL6]TSO26693.1 YdcF family protein [Lactobacillus sp. LL6]
MLKVLLIILGIFLICFASFIYVLVHERRTLWAGMTFTASLFTFALLILISLMDLTDIYSKNHPWLISVFLLILILALAIIVGTVLVLIGMLIFNGIKIILKEGNHWTNYLSLGLGILFILILFIYPNFGHFYVNDWVTYVYAFILLTTLYFIYIMIMYTFTAWINLVNPKNTDLNYIVVLGAVLLNGSEVSPLLGARIKRGIEIMKKNPGSKLIMSGGQGNNESIPEGVAMAKFAEKLGVPKNKIIIEDKSKTTYENIMFSHKLMGPNSKFCLVTNSYHVYRALVLAKNQGFKCIGYGAKTKWYFTLNAFIREFIAYVVITKRLQASIVGIIFILCSLAAIIDNVL